MEDVWGPDSTLPGYLINFDRENTAVEKTGQSKKTLVAPFLSPRVTASGSPRMAHGKIQGKMAARLFTSQMKETYEAALNQANKTKRRTRMLQINSENK